ncbi:pyruvate kinase [Dongia soli]|uniref:Pyruvate kinase n=1 Tax=Dongia soli TaxID=600628 RepID=A0ABU5EEW7_9PROT|nr:pyruvate kinase [Dongia soli]MDY0884166.1 pyruvate kinase [Dongia soli]
MRRQRKAKIVATLGPSSTTHEQIEALFRAGADIFRLNLSHGSHDDHRTRYEIIRTIEADLGRPIGVLVDLQGPKLRVGTFAEGAVQLKNGAKFRFDLDTAPGNDKRAPLPHPEILSALHPDTNLLLDDGKLRLKVLKCGNDFADCEVMVGGKLSDRKGVNVPDVVLPLSPLTRKDHADLTFGLDLGADWVALSFVQRPEDIAEARKLIQGRARIIAKLEKPAAIEHLQEIVDLSDAIMVARGDLGVEMPPEDVPSLQKRIIATCRRSGKPVVVATQMLDSMVQNPAPTRAEASDVATAVYDGADAVMLSAESASGQYPVEAVTMMNRIIERVERDPVYRRILEAQRPEPEATGNDAISAAAAQVAHTLSVAAIVTYTTLGSTGLRMARERPQVPILCMTSKEATARQLCLVWGIHCVISADLKRFSEMADKACRAAQREGFAKKGERLVITAGVPLGTPGSTNILRVAWIED